MALRLLPLIACLALLIAPFGRMAAAEAMPAGHHDGPAAEGHCPGMAPEKESFAPKAVDCMIACAVVVATGQESALPVPCSRTLPSPATMARAAGLVPEAEPPPPRYL